LRLKWSKRVAAIRFSVPVSLSVRPIALRAKVVSYLRGSMMVTKSAESKRREAYPFTSACFR
jgi:hypothetical protein